MNWPPVGVGQPPWQFLSPHWKGKTKFLFLFSEIETILFPNIENHLKTVPLSLNRWRTSKLPFQSGFSPSQGGLAGKPSDPNQSGKALLTQSIRHHLMNISQINCWETDMIPSMCLYSLISLSKLVLSLILLSKLVLSLITSNNLVLFRSFF